jgi:hypothetical protein
VLWGKGAEKTPEYEIVSKAAQVSNVLMGGFSAFAGVEVPVLKTLCSAHY